MLSPSSPCVFKVLRKLISLFLYVLVGSVVIGW